MLKYRAVSRGFINADLNETEVSNAFKNLNLLRKDAYNDFELVVGGHVSIETMRISNLLTSGSFRQFMEANYDSGKGPLSGLIKDIAHYLNGKVGHRAITTSINIEEQKIRSQTRIRSATYSPSKTSGSSLPLLEDGYIIHDFDLYRLMAGISPANVGRFFQLFGGETFYV